MKQFLEEYGRYIIVAVVIAILIGLVVFFKEPITASAKNMIAKLSGTTDKQLDALTSGQEEQKTITMPNKGDVITITDAPSGQQSYKVLKTNGNVAEVILSGTPVQDMAFNTNGSNVYENSDLDNYLNITWYNTLSQKMKDAIVAKTFSQEEWSDDKSTDDVTYHFWRENNSSGVNYYLYKYNANYGNSITRNVYSIGIQDTIDYLDLKTIDKVEEEHINSLICGYKDFWLRSAMRYINPSPNLVMSFDDGGARPAPLENSVDVTETRAVRPAFQIDLSKVDFSVNE